MILWLGLAPLINAAPSGPALLTVRLIGSSADYYVYEFRYWRGKTVACFTRKVTEDGDGPLTCHTVFWDRHREAVLSMLPELARLSAANNRIGCDGLDTGIVELEGAEQGQAFTLKGDDPQGCGDVTSQLVAKLLTLTPKIR
jgi:hypothetical protein